MTVAYPWNPHTTIYDADAPYFHPTLEAAQSAAEDFVTDNVVRYVQHQLDDVIHLSVQNTLDHVTDANTLALARSRIPAASGSDDVVRFLIAFQYEKSLGVSALISEAKASIIQAQSGYVIRLQPSVVRDQVRLWNTRAVRFVEVMKQVETDFPSLAQFDDFIRDWALVDLGHEIGVQINTTTTPAILSIQNAQGIPTYHTMPAGKKLIVRRINGIWNRSGATADDTGNVGITGKNGASFVTTYSGADFASRVKNADHLLTEGTTWQLDYAKMKHEITSRIIAWPVVNTPVPVQRIRRGATESVDISNTFTGERMTITAVVTTPGSNMQVRINHAQTSMGVSPGTRGGEIRLTATNDSGSVSTIVSVQISRT